MLDHRKIIDDSDFIDYTKEVIIITCSHDRRMKIDKDNLKSVLKREGFEIIRVHRIKRL